MHDTCRTYSTPRRFRHSRAVRRGAESPVAVDGGRSERSPQYVDQHSSHDVAVSAVPLLGDLWCRCPRPLHNLRGGRRPRTRCINSLVSWMQEGRHTAWHISYMPVPLIDRPGSISRHAVHSQHSSQQSSVIICHICGSAAMHTRCRFGVLWHPAPVSPP